MSQSKVPALILPIPIDLQRHLDTVEFKLEAGKPLSEEHDIKLMKDLIPCFHRLWRLSKQYPILNSNLDINMFKNIFNDMSVDYSTSNPKSFHLICDFCGAKFPIIGNNAELAFQSHSLTVRHVEAIRRMFKTSDNLTKSISSDISMQLKNMKLDDSDFHSSAMAIRSGTMSESSLECIESKSEIEPKLDEEAISDPSSMQMILSTTNLDKSNGTFERPSKPSVTLSKPQFPPPPVFSSIKRDDNGKGHLSRSNLSYSQPTSGTESFEGSNIPKRAASTLRSKFTVQNRLLRFRQSQDVLLKKE